MRLETQEVASGSFINAKIWICDLRYNDYNNKPIRNVKPTQVLVVRKDEVNKKVYYSQCCFLKLNKKGVPLKSSVIPLFDNTGYRSYSGVALNCFDNKEECIAFYKSEVNKAIEGLEEYIKKVKKDSQDKIAEFKELIEKL